MTGVTIFHLEKEEKGIYLLGTNIRDLFRICSNTEEKSLVFEYILNEMIKILGMVDKEKYPKRGVLFYIPELEEHYKWYIHFSFPFEEYILQYDFLTKMFSFFQVCYQCTSFETKYHGLL